VLPLGLLLAVLLVPNTPAAQSRSLSLTVTIKGQGIVRLSTGRQIACASSCNRTVLVSAGSRITLATRPSSGWKFGSWTGACQGTASTCRVRIARAARVGVTFLAPGVKKNPIPLGTEASPDGLWRLSVQSSELHAQDLIVQLSATATGADLYLYQLWGNLFIAGRLFEYTLGDGSCTPPSPDFHYFGFYGFPPYGRAVPKGQTVTGYLCVKTSHNDPPFVLFTEPGTRSINLPTEPPYPPDAEAVWFALR
jgi:hypothetical protein